MPPGHCFVHVRPVPVLGMNRARSTIKKSIGTRVRVWQEGIEVPPILFQFAHLLCNLLFALICVFNKRRDISKILFKARVINDPIRESLLGSEARSDQT